MSDTEIIAWARRFVPSLTDEEALEAHAIYRAYRDEGQSELVSRQYAGLL